MTTRWLLALFLALTFLGSALTMSGCDDENPTQNEDLSVVPDLRQHD